MADRKLFEEAIEDMKHYGKSCFETGFTDLDDLLGIRKRGTLITIGARPAMGKTSFLYNILENVSKKGGKSILFSLEMSKEQVAKRLLCQISEINSIKYRSGYMQSNDWQNLSKAVEELIEFDFVIDDTRGITVEDIESKIKNIKPEVVFIDYLQLISAPKKMDRYTQIEHIMKELKRIALENELVIFINSQLSRSLEQRYDRRPILSDLRESGGIENISDIVIFIYRDEYYNFADDEYYARKGIAEIIVAKNKFGPCGVINLKFVSALTKFYNLAKGIEF